MSTPPPTTADLDAIEAEWPVIAAEIAVVDTEIRLAALPSLVTVRAHRRAVAHLNTVTREHSQTAHKPAPGRILGRVPVIAIRPRPRPLAVAPASATA